MFNFLSYYLGLGLICLTVVLIFTEEYLRILRTCLLWIKLAQNKSSPRPRLPEEIAQQLDRKTDAALMDHVAEINNQPAKINKDLLVLVLGWPLILLVILVAGVLRVGYLTPLDLPSKKD